MTAAMLSPLPCPAPGLAGTASRLRKLGPLPGPGPAAATPAAPPWQPARILDASTAFPSSWPTPEPLPAAAPAGVTEFPEFPPQASQPPPAAPEAASTPDFTDDDLRDALSPIMERAVRKAVYAQEHGIDTYLEPMLRATIRRALAEYAPAERPFRPPGVFDRLLWHLRALFTSRTYEEIFFEKTRRFQVEEVYLLDARSLALVSFASCDPARHASVRRVTGTAQQLALLMRDENGRIRASFEAPGRRMVLTRTGGHVVLAAIVRGRPGELLGADLEYALRRIEDHFREQFMAEGSPLLYPLQPFLEDCLLIQAPASNAA
jgi:hypothetical protein